LLVASNEISMQIAVVAEIRLKLKRIGIDTHRESIAFLENNDLLGRALGLHPLDRVEVSANGRTVLAVLNTVEGTVLREGTIGLSNTAFEKLGVCEDTTVDVSPAEPPASTDLLRAKMIGRELSSSDLAAIVDDIVRGRFSKVELTAFVVSTKIFGLSDDEIASLVDAMVKGGERLRFDTHVVADKHCTGGVPGNRTTPIVVSIVAAAGLVIPKTSSRSITSPAGTADTMEALMNVELPPDRIYDTVRKANGCLAWGGGLSLAPADDMLIQVEHPLSIDAEGLMISSILAKKKAAGSTHILLDIPYGPGTKAVNAEKAVHLKERFQRLASRLELNIRVLLTDGSQPIGNGIGPVLEARDVLKVLRNDPDAPDDLRRKSIHLAGELLELTGRCSGEGHDFAELLLTSGRAYEKFEAIREIQGRRESPQSGSHVKKILADRSGRITSINNRVIGRIAQLVGAPKNPGAGVHLAKHVNDFVDSGETLLRIYADSDEALSYAVHHWQEKKSSSIIIS
jgi:thymidine phosphorylase